MYVMCTLYVLQTCVKKDRYHSTLPCDLIYFYENTKSEKNIDEVEINMLRKEQSDKAI